MRAARSARADAIIAHRRRDRTAVAQSDFNDALIDIENINHLYNDPLWTHDARGTLVPRLAARVPTRANGDVSADGRTIVVRLRHDVRWQDGAPFTSDDVRFSWQAVMDDRNNVGSRDGVDQVERIDLPDRFTAVIHLRRRYAAAIPAMLPEMIPAHLLRGIAMATAPFDAAPIGTGPFAWSRGNAAIASSSWPTMPTSAGSRPSGA